MSFLGRLLKLFPTFLLSLALAVTVWISAVTSTDPTEERQYPRQVTIEFIGQDPATILTAGGSTTVSIRLSAPRSIWDRLTNDRNPVRAVVDLSGLEEGTYELPVQVQVNTAPVKIVSYTPKRISLSMERLQSQQMPVSLVRRGDIAIGYKAGQPSLDPGDALISGPQSIVERVVGLQVILDMTKANDTITRALDIQAVDANGLVLNGLTIEPAKATIIQPVVQMGGYRNVVVKVVTTGLVSDGYRLTTISVSPAAVTVFANDPSLVDSLPGYVETSPVDLTGARDDIDTRLTLNLPAGISVVGDQTVNVVVGIAAIEGSLALNDMPIEVINLGPGLTASLSPETLNLIVSGPLPLLDRLLSGDVRIIIDLGGISPGTYQMIPRVELAISEVQVQSVLPSSIEVVVEVQGTPTPTPRPTQSR
jgi:YbbR domain-containing protein